LDTGQNCCLVGKTTMFCVARPSLGKKHFLSQNFVLSTIFGFVTSVLVYGLKKQSPVLTLCQTKTSFSFSPPCEKIQLSTSVCTIYL